MPSSLILILFIIFQLSTSFTQNSHLQFAQDTLEETHGNIIFSSLLFRHGDRAISKPYQTDPNPQSVWKQGLGQLTKRGKERAFKLGEWIRERYQYTLLKDGFNVDRISANSSSVDRTIMSGQLVLAGALPPLTSDEKWSENPSLLWQPIPLYAISSKVDNMISVTAPCDRIDYEKETLNSNTEVMALYEKDRNIFEYYFERADHRKQSDNFVENFEILWDIYDDMSIEESYNLTLPLWARRYYPEPLRTVAQKRFEISVYSPELKRLTSGILLGNIVNNMEQKRTDRLYNQTVHFYSGHDTTVAPLLQLLGIYNSIVPPFSSLVMIELRRKYDEYIVTLSYRNSSDVPPYYLQIPGCGNVCTLDQFIKITEPLIISDWTSECQVSVVLKLQRFNLIDIIVVLLAASILILIGLIVIRIFIANRKHHYTPL